MAREIERKFLVRHDEWRDRADEGEAISQGYLCADRERSVRIRLTDSAAVLTIKGKSRGISRDEYEYEVPRADAEQMLEALCVGTPISKIRYRVEHGDHVWEVDVFEGANAGLVLAEVELDHEDRSIDPPDWVGEEVSEDERYYNAYLTRQPFEDW